ncbi:MAG: hypothetical protein I8H71_15030 [Xanthomonadaceae bacterium]|nr:hypothetical protein [Xanthomonadaceae bacterium]
MSDQKPDCADSDEPCIESKLLALHTSTVCLARALLMSGALDRQVYHSELDMGRHWLAKFDHAGHNLKAFDGLLEMLKDI